MPILSSLLLTMYHKDRKHKTIHTTAKLTIFFKNVHRCLYSGEISREWVILIQHWFRSGCSLDQKASLTPSRKYITQKAKKRKRKEAKKFNIIVEWKDNWREETSPWKTQAIVGWRRYRVIQIGIMGRSLWSRKSSKRNTSWSCRWHW